MQITFDPLNASEAAAVAKMLGFGPLAISAMSASAHPEGQKEVKRLEAVDQEPAGNAAPSAAAVDPSQIAPGVLEGFSGTTATAAPAVSAPTPPAPSAPAAPSSPAADGERDIHGLPWDARIHSSGENRKNADGSWRARRGTDPQLKATVEAELRAAAGGGAPLVPAAGVAPNIPAVPNVVTILPVVPPVPAAPATDTTPPPVGSVATASAPATETTADPLVPPVPASSPPPTAHIPSVPPVPAAATAAVPSAGDTGEETYKVEDVIQFVNKALHIDKVLKNSDLDASLVAVGLAAGQFAMLFGAAPDKLTAFMRDFSARVPQ